MTCKAPDPLEEYYFEEENENICGRQISPITAEYCANYPSIVDRFFTRYYYIKQGASAEPYQVLFHSNRICLICLAPEHSALKRTIESINFDFGKADRTKNMVRGKGKKGGMPLQDESTLCVIKTSDGNEYKVPSCIRGKLIEININLTQNPNFLRTAREGEAYIAIVLPKIENCDEIKSTLLSEDQYNEHKHVSNIK